MADKDMSKAAATDKCRVCTGRKVLIGSAVAFLILATALSMCMVVVFIHSNKMLNRMEELEVMISTCNCQANKKETTRDILQSLMNSPQRNKRRILKPISDDHNHSSHSNVQRKSEETEPEHVRNEHHGVPSYNIALVYGDPQVISSAISSPLDGLQFTQNTESADAAACGILYERADKQMWCTVKNYRTISRYRTSLHNSKFYYFEKASWMNSTKSVRSYNLTADGRVVVEQQGIYIVHASIHFFALEPRDRPYYGVYKTDRLGGNRKLLSKCVVSPGEHEIEYGPGVYPCQTWQLVHLNAGDQVFMRIGAYVWFVIEKESFHLALIKLNDYSL